MYRTIITNQEARGFIEKVNPTCIDQPAKVHYLPHHPVRKESATTPVRIVIIVVLVRVSNMPAVLITRSTQFYYDFVAFATDIEKAFAHVTLHDLDKYSTRFLWVSDINNPFGALTTYRLK